MVVWLIENPKINGLFNCGVGKARSFLDLAKAVYAALDKPFKVQYIPTPESIRDKYQYFTEADMAQAHNAGFTRVHTPLEEGVERYVRDFLTREDPYR